MTIRDRIIEYLKRHPDGVDDDDLARALNLKARQQANSRCRQLETEGFLMRRVVNGKIHNFWLDKQVPRTVVSNSPRINIETGDQPWFWEGNVQNAVVRHLVEKGYAILSVADTASKEHGKDIVAQKGKVKLWVSVKGFPKGTAKTRPSTQAGHWFKGVVFDMLRYRGESSDAELGVAIPDFPRYRKLAEMISWLQPIAKFTYLWVHEEGEVAEG